MRNPWLYFWTLLLALGFAYVAGVLCGRSMPLQARNGGYQEFIKLLISAPILFWMGAGHAFKPFREGEWPRLASQLLLVGLACFAGLHWFYLQMIPAINFSLTGSDLAHMGLAARGVFLAAGVLLLGLFGYHLRLARRDGILLPYASAFVGGILVIAVLSWLLRHRASVHIHHYFLFGYFIPFLRFRNPVTLLCLGFCAGVYVEGVSEWSMALLWDFH